MRASTLLRARDLRSDPTDAENLLWRHLRNRQLGGAKFRRQHPIGPYFVDFCCVESKLVVELDGGQHAEERKAYDDQRSTILRQNGFRVLRLWNNEVFEDLENVLQTILDRL